MRYKYTWNKNDLRKRLKESRLSVWSFEPKKKAIFCCGVELGSNFVVIITSAAD